LSKDTGFIRLSENNHKSIINDIYFKPYFAGLLFPFFIYTACPVLKKTMGASFVGGFLIFIAVIAIFLKLTRKTEYIRFPPGSYQAPYEGICYKINPYSDTVETTQKLSVKYSSQEKKKTINLVNWVGEEEIQKRSKLLSKLALVFLILSFTIMFFPHKYGGFRSAGITLTFLMGIVSLYLSINYDSAMEYYMDSYCKNCGQHLVLEEFQVPLMKNKSRNDTHETTLTRYWRCKNCGYKDIKVESQHVSHHQGKKPAKSKSHRCRHCGRVSALEEYRTADIIKDSYSEIKRRYYRCRYCGYHEIKINEEIYVD